MAMAPSTTMPDSPVMPLSVFSFVNLNTETGVYNNVMLLDRILSPPELSDRPVLTTELLIFPSLPLNSDTLTLKPIQQSYAISTHLAILLEEVPLVDGEVRLVRVSLPHLLLQLHLLQ